MTHHAVPRSDHRWSSGFGTTSAAGGRLPARLRKRRALLVPPFPDRIGPAAP